MTRSEMRPEGTSISTRIAARASAAWVLLLCALLGAGCRGDTGTRASQDEAHEGESVHEGEDAHEDEGVVRLSPEELDEFGIELGAASPGRIQQLLHLPGEVHPNEDRLAHIVPRFEGIVTQVHRRIGDSVRSGDVLAVVESDQSLVPYELKTLIDGTVIAKHVTQGEAVTREHEAFVIADLTTVWVDLSLHQRDLSRVRVGRHVRISAGEDGETADAVISYVTPAVDEETRTATARVVLPNPRGIWRPGMFVLGQVVVDDTEVAIAVPRTALETIDDKPVVFIETEDGLRARPIRLGREGATMVEVLSGLDAGQRYVTRGGFTLKAELSKAAFGDGHAH